MHVQIVTANSAGSKDSGAAQNNTMCKLLVAVAAKYARHWRMIYKSGRLLKNLDLLVIMFSTSLTPGTELRP